MISILETPDPAASLTEKAVETIADITKADWMPTVQWQKIVEAVRIYENGINQLNNKNRHPLTGKVYGPRLAKNEIAAGFQDRLRQARIAAGLSQSDVVQRLNIKNGTLLSRWETQSGNPTRSNLEAMAELYNVSPTWLLTGEEPTP